MDLDARIPNNVDLKSDEKLKRALEHWQPSFRQWWMDMGPEGFQQDDIYLRTAIAVDSDGWAQFDYVKMPEYRWGIFLANEREPEPIGFGDMEGRPSFDEVPGEFRNALRRIIVTQGDTEPASVEQQRRLGHTCPSLYDLRNLFQVNVEEGRHLWAMVYLLHRYFGRDGREEAEEMLARRSGNPDKPRILQAFNQPCEDWLSFFAFTHFIDRDGKYQLAALAESGFAPLRRSTRFMLTEEAHHLFVGETGILRVAKRTAQLHKQSNGDVRKAGGIPFDVIQRYVNFWFSYGLDLFGGEISSNSADWFAAGLKGRFREADKYTDHRMLEASLALEVVQNGRLAKQEVPYRNALNEVLRDEYVKYCERALATWNRVIAEEGVEARLVLPSRRFHRHVGAFAEHWFDREGTQILDEAAWDREKRAALPSDADREYVKSLMVPVTKPGSFANWIAPPLKGINGQPLDFEYVKFVRN
jgi:benzoyl-CoA 2,3-epoxidase subunit B